MGTTNLFLSFCDADCAYNFSIIKSAIVRLVARNIVKDVLKMILIVWIMVKYTNNGRSKCIN